MAYTPTDWNDDAAPAINDSNLDKIEQGIADAHTTADAAIAKAILDAAGDLVSASAADTPARLALGANDEVLSVNAAALDYRKVVNAMVDDAAALAYSKLNLTASIVNADVAVAAAIAYSKLNLAASIVNADINSAAAIVYSKLALTDSIVDADINSAAAIAYSKLALTASIVPGDFAETAWTSFTPVIEIGAGGQTITVGNGTLTGAYELQGKTLRARYKLIFGSTTAGASVWPGGGSFTGPIFFVFPAGLSATETEQGIGTAHLQDSGTNAYGFVATGLPADTARFVLRPGAGGFLDEDTPFTPVATDVWAVTIQCEVA